MAPKEARVAAAAVSELRSSVKGAVIAPADAGYDAARMVWNARIDYRPAAIVRCTGVDDIVAAVAFARREGLVVAPRSSGHHVAGYGSYDGGLVLDLSALKGVEIDPEERTARIQPGVTWGDFDRAGQEVGLFTTGASLSTVGVAGMALTGGEGWLMNKFGLTCDNLLAAKVATADGNVVTASAEENPDLLWALRGGGGNFGVVTEFTFRVHPVGTVLGGFVAYPLEQAPEVLRFTRDWFASVSEEVGCVAALIPGRAEPFIPAELQNKALVTVAVCHQDPSRAADELRPLREFGAPPIDLFNEVPYAVLQGMFDQAVMSGRRNYWASAYFDRLDDALIDVIVERSASKPAFSQIDIHALGGATMRGEDSAFAHRSAAFELHFVGTWTDAVTDEAATAWVQASAEAVRPYATGGSYANHSSLDDERGSRAAYGVAKYERLSAIKRKYDPTNLFAANQNVAPAA